MAQPSMRLQDLMRPVEQGIVFLVTQNLKVHIFTTRINRIQTTRRSHLRASSSDLVPESRGDSNSEQCRGCVLRRWCTSVADGPAKRSGMRGLCSPARPSRSRQALGHPRADTSAPARHAWTHPAAIGPAQPRSQHTTARIRCLSPACRRMPFAGDPRWECRARAPSTREGNQGQLTYPPRARWETPARRAPCGPPRPRGATPCAPTTPRCLPASARSAPRRGHGPHRACLRVMEARLSI
jgi:hypothetical protein